MSTGEIGEIRRSGRSEIGEIRRSGRSEIGEIRRSRRSIGAKVILQIEGWGGGGVTFVSYVN